MKRWVKDHKAWSMFITILFLAVLFSIIRRIQMQQLTLDVEQSLVAYIVAGDKKLEYYHNEKACDDLIGQLNGTYTWEKKIYLLFPQSGAKVLYFDFYNSEGNRIARVGYADENTIAIDKWNGYIRYKKKDSDIDLSPFLSYISRHGKSITELESVQTE